MYVDSEGKGGTSSLILMEEADGTVRGRWDEMDVVGKRAGADGAEWRCVASEITYQVRCQPASGGRVMHVRYTTENLQRNVKAKRWSGTGLLAQAE
jgi:hypothetical protein